MISPMIAAMTAEVAYTAAWFAVATVASALLTFLARRYALHRELLDHPGQRRSHGRATPRGGGIAPAVVVLAGGTVSLVLDPAQAPGLATCLVAFAAVAAIGWLDDHRPLPAWLRLIVHLLAGLAAGIAVIGMPQAPMQCALVAASAIVVAGFINMWNFMDGIDGLSASQAGLVAIALLIGGGSAGLWLDDGWRIVAWSLCAAMVGFLPFNFPRARIFLGDVGSGALGFVVACLLLRAVVAGGLAWPLAVLLPSAFLIDAGLTLGARAARGKRWWRPHREHLYQWLVRIGYTHVHVTCMYALWTTAACALTLSIATLSGGVGAWISAGALISGCFLWMWLRKWIWIAARHRTGRRR